MKVEKIICKNCVMDTSDLNILFDDDGTCIYCLNFFKKILPYWKEINNEIKLKSNIEKIKENEFENGHNCIIGVSGGVDSSYLLHLAVREFGLKPLVYHVDAGWNSKIAVENIEKIVDRLDLELYTDVIYWPEMRDLQLSFFKANVPHLDTPQDHAFFASMYNYCEKNNIKSILNGGNFSTESIREPLLWHYHASDALHIRHIQKLFGTRQLSSFPISDIFTYKIFYNFIKKIKVYQLLNNINYNKSKATAFLKEEYNWTEYSHKHGESRFTRFYEGYWLLKKFGFDKRKAHYSSLILSNQMSRHEALVKLKIDPISDEEIKKDIEFVANKLSISTEELNSYFHSANLTFENYKSNYYLINIFTIISRLLGLEKRIIK